MNWADRALLGVIPKAHRQGLRLLVTPDTILRWHRWPTGATATQTCTSAATRERGTTTTPFDMVRLNDLDRFHLVIDAIDRVPGLADRAGHIRQLMADGRLEATAYTRQHGEDMPQVRDWAWPY